MLEPDRSPPRAALAVAAGVTLLHLATANGYGIFRDELYYLACADHLDWGYVDHPPLSIAILAVVRSILGDSLLALRLVPALLHGWVVWATARLALRMGARSAGAVLAAVATGFAPGLLGIASFYSMNAIDVAAHTAAALVLATILANKAPSARGRGGLWILLGVIVGLGCLNKYSMALFGAALGAGLLLSPRRRDLTAPWPWLAAIVAALLLLPHLFWQIETGWPTREFIANAQRYKIAALSPGEFLVEVWLEMLPPSALLGLPGWIALLVWRPLRAMRPLGIAALVVLIVLLAERSKPYYMDAVFPLLFASGGVVWTRIRTRPGWRWTAPALSALLLVSGPALAPLALPLLPPEMYRAYSSTLGVTPQSGEDHAIGALPQHFADRFGWPEMAASMARAYHALPAEDRARCAIVGRNYGQAGALRYHGRALGLPAAISQHNSFYLWGPGESRLDLVLSIGQSREDLLTAFEEVTEVERFDHPYAMPYERNAPIYLCRRLRMPAEEAWRLGRLYL